MTKLAFETCLYFLYTGRLYGMNSDLDNTIKAAELLNLPELNNQFLNQKLFNDHKSAVMKDLFFNKTLYSDITFVVNGQKIPAHRCVLSARCEVMSAMFSGHFVESKITEVRSYQITVARDICMIPDRWNYQE